MRKSIVIGILAMALCGCAGAEPRLPAVDTRFVEAACSVGVYGGDETFVAITRRNDTFRYSFHDGRAGKVDEAGPIECGNSMIRLERQSILSERNIKVTDTQFDADGVMLSGQLLEPENAGAETPLVVLAHGSEETGWIEAVSYPYQMVARGVSVFVYDKRGTGRSAGQYSQNFPQLADDLVTASLEAKRLAGDRYGRFGLFGFSQGGWIVPLAAKRSGADFLGIGYGLVVDILEEDASQVELELREAGYGDDVIAEARQITDVTARLAVSNYSDGLEELDALRRKYGGEQWFSMVQGGFTGVILGFSTDELRKDGIPMFDRLNIDWTIKPMDVLRKVNVPQLWVLAANDREAPISKTYQRLDSLRRAGKNITIYQFPNTDHGMWEFEQSADGTRKYTRVVSGYYRLLADWAKGDVKGPYADSVKR